MRVHTNLTTTEMRDVLRASGAPIEYESVTRHRSKTHPRAFEVRLTGTGGRTNSGHSGAGDIESPAATWDEWGAFFGALYYADPAARSGGSAGRPVYADAVDFHQKTGGRFRGRWVNIDTFSAHRTYLPTDVHPRHHWVYEKNAGFRCTHCTANRPLTVPRTYAV